MLNRLKFTLIKNSKTLEDLEKIGDSFLTKYLI